MTSTMWRTIVVVLAVVLAVGIADVQGDIGGSVDDADLSPVYDPTFTPEDFTPYTYDNDTELLVTHRAYLDVTIDGVEQERIVIGLFGSIVPETVRNFLCLAEGKRERVDADDGQENVLIGYSASFFHRVTEDYIQGGAFYRGGGMYSGRSCNGSQDFENENYLIDHIGQGWVSMANVGSFFGSQFIIALKENSWLNGADTVFGKVLSGAKTLMAIEALETDEETHRLNNNQVYIMGSGVLPTQPFTTSKQPVLMVRENEDVITDRVFMRVRFGEHDAPVPIVIGLFGDTVPHTVDNFLRLARGYYETGSDGVERYVGYTGSKFSRITSWYIQAGSFETEDHSYGKAALDMDFEHENFELHHYGAGWVSMADVGEFFGSQFCISLDRNNFRDGEDTVFGKILSGMDIVQRIAATPYDDDNAPYETEITIIDAGVLTTDEPLSAPLKAVQPEDLDSEVTRMAYFDITQGGQYRGRILFGLFDKLTPITADNFACLCEGRNGVSYVNTTFHRVIDRFMVQGGDTSHLDGYGFRSCYGGNFNDENFVLRNTGAAWLGMANAGPNTNGGQFYIPTVRTEWLDNKHVIFGKVLSGFDVVKIIEYAPRDENDKPYEDIKISACEVVDLTDEQHFVVDKNGKTCDYPLY